MDGYKMWSCVRKFLALVWKCFIVHEDNIIILSNDTKISELINISCVFLEMSSMCPMSQKNPIGSKLPACVWKFMACVLKFPYWYKFLECVRKFPAYVRKLRLYKNITFVFYHIHIIKNHCNDYTK